MHTFLLKHLIKQLLFPFPANSAAFAAGILFFLTYFPVFFLSGDRFETMSQGEKMAAGLLSNVAMAFGINAFMIYEGTGTYCNLVLLVFVTSVGKLNHSKNKLLL